MAVQWINILVLVGLLMLNGVTSFPDGAPEEACNDMTPNHLTYSPQLAPAPFTISVSPDKFIVGEALNGKFMLSMLYLHTLSCSCVI